MIRADDLLFRWGGDEFLVILRQVNKAEARRRCARVNEILAGEADIEQADAVRYEGKRSAVAVGR